MTKDLDIPTNIDLADRELAFLQLSIGAQENERFVRMVKAAMPGREREADLMVAHKQWPLLVARMAEMERQEKLVEKHLAGLMKDTSWEQGKGTVGSRLVQATQPPAACAGRGPSAGSAEGQRGGGSLAVVDAGPYEGTGVQGRGARSGRGGCAPGDRARSEAGQGSVAGPGLASPKAFHWPGPCSVAPAALPRAYSAGPHAWLLPDMPTRYRWNAPLKDPFH
ncbi:hypothetical protein SBADM41S_03782 [Streptomyces badius]